MNPRTATREQLNSLLDELCRTRELYAPCRTDSWTEFRRTHSSAEIDTTMVNTRLPAKPALFPQCEKMFSFDAGAEGAGSTGTAADTIAEQVWFGLRPCDAAGLMFLERFFAGSGMADPYVQERRQRTTIVALACNSPADTCFCLAVGGSPAGTKGSDLLITELADRLLAEPLTPSGEALVATLPQAPPDDLERKQEIIRQAEARISLRIDAPALKQRLDKGFEDPVWESLSLPCVNCGICTFLCPTCHCFDVTDEKAGSTIERIRVWDSCQFSLYSQHASGHNPRAHPRSRYRNRVMDKFCYTVEQVGEISCTGCGRCIQSCPMAIDIRETVATLLNTLTG